MNTLPLDNRTDLIHWCQSEGEARTSEQRCLELGYELELGLELGLGFRVRLTPENRCVSHRVRVRISFLVG